jgi:2-polyprenyl-3-methyl-5-hydroxy-6-metoxy-1,4-benzoquinol methylase
MISTTNKYEYSYQDSNLSHHHNYLIKLLMSMIYEHQDIRENKSKLRILDIGCGNGSLSNFIAQRGYEVVGVEESESGVKFASKSFPDCRFFQGSVYDLPYTELEEKFDIVISAEVIEHLFYPKELVKNAEVLNVKKYLIKIAQNMVIFGLRIKTN